MSFTARLGDALSRLANLVLGFGATRNRSGSGSVTLPVPTISGTGTYTPPRYPFINQTGAFSGGAGSASGSFPALPLGGNFILVEALAANTSTNVTDNQGNTYHRVPASASRVGFTADIWYAYNIGTPAGTFTVTITSPGGNVWGNAKHYSGFGTNDPLAAYGDNGFGGSGAIDVTASPATVNPNALGCSVCTTSNVFGASMTAAPVQFVVDFNFGGFSGAAASGLIKVAGAQSVTWDSTLGGHTAVIAIFQDPADFATVRATQEVQSQVVAYSATERATQLVQSQATQSVPMPRVTQVVLTVIVVQTGCPERPVIGGVIEGGDVPATAPPAPVICDNPGSKPIIGAAAEGGDVPAATVPTSEPCDTPGTKPTITGAV